jgi:hypothetical protein
MGDRLGIPRALSIFAFEDFEPFLTGLNSEHFLIDLEDTVIMTVQNFLSLIFRR